MKAKAFLFGPFVGELCWEFFRFVPYAIYLKKHHPGSRLIVLTRPSRFDLYGQYADIIVPLRLKNDSVLERDSFKLTGYKEENYYTIAKYFKQKFRKRYNIVKHSYPDVRMWRYKVKWQFPRDKMDYDFKPRKSNIELASRALRNKKGIVDNTATKKKIIREDIIDSIDLACRITNFVDDIKSTTLGCMIECLKSVEFVIGDIRSDTSHLALLLGTPLIHVGKPIKEDFVKLANPLNTPLFVSDTIEQGIEIYENNI